MSDLPFIDAQMAVRGAAAVLGAVVFLVVGYRHLSGKTGRMVASVEGQYGVHSAAAAAARRFVRNERLIVLGWEIIAAGAGALVLAAIMDLPDWLKWASIMLVFGGGAVAVIMLLLLSFEFSRLGGLVGFKKLRGLFNP